jgi:hypothetical protein
MKRPITNRVDMDLDLNSLIAGVITGVVIAYVGVVITCTAIGMAISPHFHAKS